MGRAVDTVECTLAGREGWVCRRWPVCDPQHIPCHGLLVRALVLYWPGTDPDWHACTVQLRLIIVQQGTDCPEWQHAGWSSKFLHVWRTKSIFWHTYVMVYFPPAETPTVNIFIQVLCWNCFQIQTFISFAMMLRYSCLQKICKISK